LWHASKIHLGPILRLMQSTQTQSSIGIGFFAIAALFFAIVAIWLTMVSNNNANLRQLDRGESQRQLVFAMRDAAHQRNLALFRMVALQDAFARDSEYLRFKESAGHFIIARQQLLKQFVDANTTKHWEKLKPLIQHSETLQNAIVEMIMEDNNASALALIQQEFIPTQRRVSRELSKMLNATREDIIAKLDAASAATHTHYKIILLLVLVATSVGYVIAKMVVRRNVEAHNVLQTKNQQVHALNAAMSKPHTTIEEQISSILKLGSEFLRLESVLLFKREFNLPATVLDRHPATPTLQTHSEQQLVDYLPNTIEDTEILLVTPSSPSKVPVSLSELLQIEGITTLIATKLKATSRTEHFVVFLQKKNIPLPSDANELIDLLSNKLTVLLEQQETLSYLQHARLAAETANKAKNVFLANITDTLRTPLNSIMNYSQELRGKLTQQQDIECNDDLDKILESGQQLNSLISNLLDMTQLESGSMTLEHQHLDIGLLLQDIKTELEPTISKTGSHFELQTLNELGTMHSDSSRIRQVLMTLLSFAGRLTQQDRISLTAWREPCPEDDWLYFEIKDNGNGISKKQLNHLFKMIITDSLDNEVAPVSAEIQLAISKKICELLGGDILVDSKPNHGTTFTVCLPCHAQQQAVVTSATA